MMADVDPRDFIDMCLVEVKPPVFLPEHLTKEDFDPDEYDEIYSCRVEDGKLFVEFITRKAADKMVEEWNEEFADQNRRLNLRSSRPQDNTKADAYLLVAERGGSPPRY